MSREVESNTDTPEQVLAANGKDAPKSEVKPEATAAKAEQKAVIRDESEASKEEQEEKESPASQEVGDEEEIDDDGEVKEEQPKKSKKGGYQRRIDKITKEREFWRAEALKQSAVPVAQPSVEAKKEAPAGKPRQEDYDTHEEYVEKLTDWKIESREKSKDAEAKAQAAQSDIKTKVDSYQKGVKAAQEKLEDYDDVIESVDHVPMPVHLNQLLLDSENGPELAYHLAKDAENFARVCKLSPIAAARELGKIEATLTKAPESAKEIKTTKAPAPIKPVGGSGSANSKEFREDMTYPEFKRWRAKTS